MSITKRQLYALGEPLGECVTRREACGRLVCGGGGGGGRSTSSSDTTSTNTDQRVAVQDGIGVSGSSGNTINMNDPDVVKAMAAMGADVISRSGAAVVELNQAGMDANVAAWDKTVTAGAALVDKLIDSNTSMAGKAIDNFQPTDNAQQNTIQWAAIAAAAGVVGYALLKP
ncbi:hypothetical protein [Hydrogenophaga laconesensis]|uniref:Uncharacterized protein n=1 Tax=Hydrogenophaga laconesensis TaxID=1805971 RepID=A0ABU1VEB4_9BURK|nr:hypothetical protein [Hydrogenophaga laconesensis]MDR7095533.1 hypothetical protein [Hydrogenophaga laconesensis]